MIPSVSMKKMTDAGGGRGMSRADTAKETSWNELIKRKVNRFVARYGRRPRVLVSHVGPGGHRRILNQVAAMFAQWGFDVDIGSINQSPVGAAVAAIENDVHMVCLLSHGDRSAQAAGEVSDALKGHMCDDILVAVYSDSPAGDNHHRDANRQSSPVGIRPADADADVTNILDMLSQYNWP